MEQRGAFLCLASGAIVRQPLASSPVLVWHIDRQSASSFSVDQDFTAVTSGAIARGMGLLRLPVRPSEMEELQAA